MCYYSFKVFKKGVFAISDGMIYKCKSNCVSYAHNFTEKPDKYLFRLHSHNTHEIYYFYKGDATFTVEGATYPLKPGTLILCESGQVHHLSVKNANIPYERVIFNLSVDVFSPSVFKKIATDGAGNHVFYLDEQGRAWFEQNCLAIEQMEGDEKTINSTLGAVVQVILARALSLSPHQNIGQKNDTAMQIAEYINANLTQKISLQTLEREFYRDKAYMNRVFKSVMGCSIWEYIIKKRVFYARTELYNTLSVSAAFSKSGFSDYSVFYRNYVKCTGVSPSADLKAFTKEEKKQ